LAKKASWAVAGAASGFAAGVAGSDEQADSVNPAAMATADRVWAGLKWGVFMSKH
jgi:hypothetical protein